VIGDLAWAERTKGRLRRRDRAALAAQGVLLALEVLGARTRRRLGLDRRSAVEADVRAMRPPQTPAARAAEELCHEVSSVAVANHTLRTYLWSRLLALRDGVAPDDELLFVTSVLHDLGLTERFWRSRVDAGCFSLDGLEATERLLAERGWSPERRRRAQEAVVLHLNVRVSPRAGPEARLMAAGTALDVAGARLRAIGRESVRAVLEQHPRMGLEEDFARWFERETAARPDGRLAYLVEHYALDRRLAASPLGR
jgi:hypothetical protein